MSQQSAKTRRDNTSLELKCEIRRRLLKPFAEKWPLRIMDCCAGTQRVWKKLRAEFNLASYAGFDLKATRGLVIRTDSARWLRDVGLAGNVIDIDTYGEPWNQYNAVLSVKWPGDELLVFLTIGMGLAGLGRISKMALSATGIPPDWQDRIPPASMRMRQIIISSCLTTGWDNDIILLRGLEASPNNSNTRYFGLWLRKKVNDNSSAGDGNAGVERA